MAFVGNSFRIPNYITARSLLGLRRLMLQNNLRNGKEYSYFDIQFVGGAWVAWYLEIEDQDKLIEATKPRENK
jgi:hypothetical protein